MAQGPRARSNSLTYDVDGAGPLTSRTLTYDLENRPLTILRNGVAAVMGYGPARITRQSACTLAKQLCATLSVDHALA
jgi:hypothetical protein